LAAALSLVNLGFVQKFRSTPHDDFRVISATGPLGASRNYRDRLGQLMDKSL
jgi:DNA-binding LytR/AlgR family response regulator